MKLIALWYPCAVVDDLAVGNLDITEHAVVQHRAGDNSEGNVDVCILAVDGNRLLLVVGVVKADGCFTALAGDFLCGHLPAVEHIGELHADGKI